MYTISKIKFCNVKCLLLPGEPSMLYRTNHDLPLNVRRLPEPTQDLYRVAFNSALHWYGEETKAHRTAWSAVRNQAASLSSSSVGTYY